MGCGTSVNIKVKNNINLQAAEVPRHGSFKCGGYYHIQQLLQDKEFRERFIQFSDKDHSLENVLFLLDVQRYMEHYVEGMGKDIFKKYIEEDAELEVHISHMCREKIRAELLAQPDEWIPHLFDEIRALVMSSIETDSLPRFLLKESTAERNFEAPYVETVAG
jgi:hypothetical protein